jgi:hypothetical protein
VEGRCARAAATFWVFLTLGATDFLCVATGVFFAAALRVGTAFRAMTFLGTRRFAATFFLTATFLVDLLREGSFDFTLLRDDAFCATALLAFGRDFAAVVDRLFAADLGDERRATARDVERLRPLVTALISA